MGAAYISWMLGRKMSTLQELLVVAFLGLPNVLLVSNGRRS